MTKGSNTLLPGMRSTDKVFKLEFERKYIPQMHIIILIIWMPILFYISSAVFYHVFLACMYFLRKEPGKNCTIYQNKYLLLIPAHNEEVIIENLFQSIRKIKYNSSHFKVIVIADNCVDKTAAITTRNNYDVMERDDPSKKGKGFAIEWALAKINLDEFDAVIILDADNSIDRYFLRGMNEVISRGANAIQCYNDLANPNESSFTRIIHLSRVVNNELYHHAKYKLGLSSYLMGNGMCFTSSLLKKHRWSASTIAEDYEYYAKLVSNNEMVAFASNSKLYHQESRGVRQATDQRIRWSSGRFEIAKKYGIELLKKGLKEKNYKILDASFPFIFPNLSLMVNITVIIFTISLFIHIFYSMSGILYWLIFLFLLEIGYFSMGIFLTKMPLLQVVYIVSYVPIFLIWKLCIDFIGVIGKKRDQWGKSKRSID